MNQETDHKKLIIFLVIILLLIVGIGLFISWWKPSQTTIDETEVPTGFSPFDRRTTYQNVDVPVTYAPETPFVERPGATVPVVAEQPAPVETRIYTTPQNNFIVQTDNTVYVPYRPQKKEAPVIYEETPQPVVVQTTYYVPPVRYVPNTPTTTPRTTQTTENQADGGLDIVELDKQIFGYVSGLGWTQLLGDTGQQIFDFLYGTTPQGTTNATLGKLLGVGGGGGGGGMGGMGGMGGGGATQPFGGMVSRVTYCTCAASIMLDINDVRGQMISLIYQPGASQVYSYYNVYGTGQNVLGNYSSGGSCMVYHGEECSAEGSPSGTITQIGTSE